MVLKDYKCTKYDDLLPCIQFLANNGIQIDDVKLYDQFCNLVSFLDSIDVNSEFFTDRMLHDQWVEFFMSCPDRNSYSEIEIICQFYFCISGHNANVERILSLINGQWSKERNRLNVSSVKSLIQVQYNLKQISCSEFHNCLIKNDDMFRGISSSEKYN